MHSIRAMIILAIIGFSAPLLAGQSGSPVGMVLEASGSAQVERDGSRNDLRLADFLYAGDRLITEAGQISFVFCPTESRIGVEQQSTVELTASGIDSVAGPEPGSSPSPCVLPQVALGAESMERVGALRGRGYPPIELYLGGQITQVRPVFDWSGIEGAESYHLLLTTLTGDFVWELDTPDTSATYPESMSALDDGQRYRWELTANAGVDIQAQQSANFTVMVDEGLAETAGAGDSLIRAVALENAGFYAEAAALYRQFREDDSDRISQRLAWLYWNAGLIAASNAELERLP